MLIFQGVNAKNKSSVFLEGKGWCYRFFFWVKGGFTIVPGGDWWPCAGAGGSTGSFRDTKKVIEIFTALSSSGAKVSKGYWFALGYSICVCSDLGGGLIFFLNMFIPLWRRCTHFDEHIFQMGWFNHQPVMLHLATCTRWFKQSDLFYPQTLEVTNNHWVRVTWTHHPKKVM